MKENKLVNIFKLNNSNQILIMIIIKKKIFITEEETLKSIKPDNLAAWTLICAFFVLVFNFVLLETLVLKYKIFFYIIIISFILFFFYRLGTSLTMDQFAWSKTEALYYMGILMSIGAVVSCITFVMIEPLCKKYKLFIQML